MYIEIINFHPFEVVSRYRDPQLQVRGKNHLVNLRPIICKSLNTHSVFNNCELTLKALKYYHVNHGDQMFFFQSEIIINVLVSSF